jgi:hypothetical protein
MIKDHVFLKGSPLFTVANINYILTTYFSNARPPNPLLLKNKVKVFSVLVSAIFNILNKAMGIEWASHVERIGIVT